MCATDEALKITIKNMQKDLVENKKEREKFRVENDKQHDKLFDGVEEIKGILTGFILKVETKFITKEKAEKLYASKLTEKLVYGTVGMMLTAMVGGLILLIVK